MKHRGETRDGFVPRMNNVRHDNVRRDAEMEADQVIIVGGSSAISPITGSKGASTNWTDSSRRENSVTESNGDASC